MMKFDPSKPVQTRDGRKARIIATDKNHDTFIIVALISEGDFEVVESFTKDGDYYEDEQGRNDLINIPEKHVRYVNIYEDNDVLKYWLSVSRNSADEKSGVERTACIRIEYEDGQFDE